MSIPIFIFSSPDRTTNAMNQQEFCVTQSGAISSGGMYGSNITDSYGSPDLSSLGDNSYRVAPSGGYDFNYFVYHSYGRNMLSGPRG